MGKVFLAKDLRDGATRVGQIGAFRFHIYLDSSIAIRLGIIGRFVGSSGVVIPKRAADAGYQETADPVLC
jgi:hypothetical protein